MCVVIGTALPHGMCNAMFDAACSFDPETCFDLSMLKAWPSMMTFEPSRVDSPLVALDGLLSSVPFTERSVGVATPTPATRVYGVMEGHIRSRMLKRVYQKPLVYRGDDGIEHAVQSTLLLFSACLFRWESFIRNANGAVSMYHPSACPVARVAPAIMINGNRWLRSDQALLMPVGCSTTTVMHPVLLGILQSQRLSISDIRRPTDADARTIPEDVDVSEVSSQKKQKTRVDTGAITDYDDKWFLRGDPDSSNDETPVY